MTSPSAGPRCRRLRETGRLHDEDNTQKVCQRMRKTRVRQLVPGPPAVGGGHDQAAPAQAGEVVGHGLTGDSHLVSQVGWVCRSAGQGQQRAGARGIGQGVAEPGQGVGLGGGDHPTTVQRTLYSGHAATPSERVRESEPTILPLSGAVAASSRTGTPWWDEGRAARGPGLSQPDGGGGPAPSGADRSRAWLRRVSRIRDRWTRPLRRAGRATRTRLPDVPDVAGGWQERQTSRISAASFVTPARRSDDDGTLPNCTEAVRVLGRPGLGARSVVVVLQHRPGDFPGGRRTDVGKKSCADTLPGRPLVDRRLRRRSSEGRRCLSRQAFRARRSWWRSLRSGCR